MVIDCHGRAHRPKGLPQGLAGTWTPVGGNASDSDLDVSPPPESERRLLRERLSRPGTDGPEYDAQRTRLRRLFENDSPARERRSMWDMFADIGEPDGGGTWNPRTGESPAIGFCWSPYPERSRVLDGPPDSAQALQDIADRFMEENRDIYDHDGNAFIGLWNDPATGKVYLDVSVVGRDAEAARDACRRHDQIAFYDLQVGASVTVDPNATSGQGG